jgi:hypothetical protein
MNPKLEKLRTGDAFKLNGQTYIALALSPDPFDVFCLNTLTKKIEEIDESERVELIEHWYVAQIQKPEGKAVRGKKLSEL